MSFAPEPCPSCGANQVVRKAGRFACTYCGNTVVPQLRPGAVCADSGSVGFCGQPACSLCRGCARPLRRRHGAARREHWQAPLRWEALCPRWTSQDAAEWGRLTAPFQRFPVEGFTPFEWTHHERSSLYQLGVTEEEMLSAIGPIVTNLDGHVSDTACALASVCDECERATMSKVEKVVAGFAERYSRVAYRDRLEALIAETQQALRYIEAFLGRPIARKGKASEELPHLEPLAVDSPRIDWDRWGLAAQARLAALERLAAEWVGPETKRADSEEQP